MRVRNANCPNDWRGISNEKNGIVSTNEATFVVVTNCPLHSCPGRTREAEKCTYRIAGGAFGGAYGADNTSGRFGCPI